MMFDVHPLHPSRPSPSQKLNRENRIKNACLSNSHSNIAASNDKRPLFVQIPATSSASLVSTSLPIQCLRLSNFFFFRGIFADNFLPNLLEYVPRWLEYVPNLLEYVPRWLEYVPNLLEYVGEVVGIRSEPTIPLKSRSHDVGVSGLIIRQKGSICFRLRRAEKAEKCDFRQKFSYQSITPPRDR